MTLAAEARPRLSAATLARARADVLPAHRRIGAPTVAHLGVGAFARAHIGVFADDLLQSGHDALIAGVSLHSVRTTELMAPQDCYYTVAEREPGVAPRLRVVGSFVSVSTGTEAALRALCAPETNLVTLTITEKGYELGPAELEHPGRPTSAAGVTAHALDHWRRSGRRPPVIAALDNVAANGSLLRSRVLQVAAALSPDLAPWIEDEVAFPNSVVDRMVPASRAVDLDEIGSQLGLADLAAVVTEEHRSWIVTAEARLAPWAESGVELVTDTGPYERRKLWLLNGPHSALAYLGLLSGCTTIAEAADDRDLAVFAARVVSDVLAVAPFPDALRPREFAGEALRRFRNPALGHTCTQVGADGSHKLPQRFGEVVEARLRAGLSTTQFAIVVALWIAAASGLEVQGRPLPALDDPDAPLLQRRREAGLDALVRTALERRFDPVFIPSVASALRRIVAEGIRVVRQS
ncbi:MAG TPA: mannitol dehydrogenase family protein [Acidimicrobiales bacterium]|nr:mannitol dehydrogenase family protein [Acidimicrobiales bacterium]